MEKVILKAEKREVLGKKVQSLRNNGLVPVVLYGKDFDNLSLSVAKNEFEKILEKAGTSTIVDLEVDGEGNHKILLHEPQYDAVTGQILHADFYKVNMKEKIHTEIPLEFVGVSAAVADLEGNLIINKDALEVECLPDALVNRIEVDITALKTFEDSIKISDLNIPEGIEISADPEEVVVLVTAPRSEEELEAMEGEAAADAEKAQIENIEAASAAEKAEKETEEGADESTPTEKNE
ncbi:MAG: 50S ribosomal protein L25, large subunit ribosomal protein L25 [Berkelbacteria bacterium GW2011_GWE1_39_12]|uniref:Large ribosomal subunit protein bL25 n=1 Tax=Berkelbacteria bacterium GW2011_GWE1_39_12 TaxID=1618337 RepID=A0A0G4B6B7_9BACT|nr:MAG: 50S ribosomal protein L25, large subunit ribosomal protein L25 [Berkelbacteria bacterium GW2011_GWE1_39_12]